MLNMCIITVKIISHLYKIVTCSWVAVFREAVVSNALSAFDCVDGVGFAACGPPFFFFGDLAVLLT